MEKVSADAAAPSPGAASADVPMEDADDGAVCLPVDDGDAGPSPPLGGPSPPPSGPSPPGGQSAITCKACLGRHVPHTCERARPRSSMREPPPPPPLVVSVSSGATPALAPIALRSRRSFSWPSRICATTRAPPRKYDSLLHALAIGGSALDARDERLLSGRAFFGTGELPPPPKHYFAPAVAPGSDEKPKKFRHGVGGL